MRIEQFIKRWWYNISICLAIGIATNLNAQKEFLETGIYGHRNVDLMRAVSDTLDDHFDTATPTLYASPNGGFVGGNSGYGETAKAQEFFVDTVPYAVEGFIYWFGYKANQSLAIDSSRLNLKFWNLNATALVNGVNRLTPYSVFDSTYLLITDLVADTIFSGGMNVWMLPIPTMVFQNYAVGFTMEKLDTKDTISLMMSTDGDAPVTEYSWERWNGSWNFIDHNWGLDADFAIFPLVDKVTASIEGDQFVQGLKFTMYPNPVSDWMNIELEPQQSGNYDLLVHDMYGRLIRTKPLGYLSSMNTSTSLDVFDLPVGTYILTITNGYKGLSKRFVKK